MKSVLITGGSDGLGKAIAEELSNEANFYQVEIDQSKGLTEEYNIEGYPTIVVFDDGQEVTSLLGAQPITVFEEVISDLNNQ